MLWACPVGTGAGELSQENPRMQVPARATALPVAPRAQSSDNPACPWVPPQDGCSGPRSDSRFSLALSCPHLPVAVIDDLSSSLRVKAVLGSSGRVFVCPAHSVRTGAHPPHTPHTCHTHPAHTTHRPHTHPMHTSCTCPAQPSPCAPYNVCRRLGHTLLQIFFLRGKMPYHVECFKVPCGADNERILSNNVSLNTKC